ncbi:hypothetical protein [Streptomyces sp.]|uniref:hypothetical protein n=1 Tax=Streptomyces sp. TaxID=1931 RepID=UPI002D450A84|nr:hypothetical protein [Streptomyces sp.]HZF90259.1 hypothetical protein [Streptomyces sp.]
MVESVLDVIEDVVPLLLGSLIAWLGWDVWRRPDEAPALMAGGVPAWVVRCWAAGFLLLGIAVAGLGGFGLAGHEEFRPLGLARMAGGGLVALSMAVAAGFRWRKRRTVPRPPAAEGG